MSNHYMSSMSVKVLVISFKILTILSSGDDDWFIHPYWGELKLSYTSLKHVAHQIQRLLEISFGNP
jgi:hypothetical protein